jgi:hypothetical protein
VSLDFAIPCTSLFNGTNVWGRLIRDVAVFAAMIIGTGVEAFSTTAAAGLNQLAQNTQVQGSYDGSTSNASRKYARRDALLCIAWLLPTALDPRRGDSRFEAATQSRDVALRRGAEQLLVVTAEVCRIFITHAVPRTRRVQFFAEHQASRLL